MNTLEKPEAPLPETASDHPRISVIVAAFNSASVIERCLRSVVGQTYDNLEFIVIDGGSTDGTVDIIKRYESQLTYWISEPDKGISDAWNKGIAQSSGQWIAFLGSDDVFWEADVVQQMVPHLNSTPPQIKVVYGTLCKITPELEIIHVRGGPWEKLKHDFRAGVQRTPHPGMMQRKSLFDQHGLFNTDYRIAIDYELLLRELLHGDAAFIPELVVAGGMTGGLSDDIACRFKVMAEGRKARRSHGLIGWTWPNFCLWLNTMVDLISRKVPGLGAAKALIRRERSRRFKKIWPDWLTQTKSFVDRED